MKAKTIISMCLFLVIALAASASAIPVDIEQVKLDGVTLSETSTNRLDIEKNQKYDVTVKLTATEDINDAELRVFVSGFEYSSTDPAQDHEGPFNMDDENSKTFKLEIDFSDEFEEDDYLLRVMVTDRDDPAEIATYRIKIDVPRNSLKIEDVIFYPENKLKDGEALLASVRVENNGDKDQEDVRVTVSVPELGMMAKSYINEVEAEDEEETEELYMKVPRCAQPGLHEVVVEVEYGEGHYKTSTSRYINVEENAQCVPAAPTQVTVETNDTAKAEKPVAKSTGASTVRKALEIILLVMVVLLVIIGLIIGFSKLGRKEEEDY